MGSYFSNTVMTEVGLDLVLVPVLDAVTQLISWLYSVVDVMDKCFDAMPRGPVGSSYGDLAEVEYTVNSSETNSDFHQQQQGAGAKFGNSLKLVEMRSLNDYNSRASSSDNWGDEKGDHVCAVCLGDIREEEKVYELPQCDHIFHSACLDRWVSHNHNTCPLCRTSLLVSAASHRLGEASIIQDDEAAGLVDEDPGFSLGIWFISHYAAANANLNNRGGWTHTVMRFVGL